MPKTQFAQTRTGASVAYQVFGEGPPTFSWFPYIFGHVELGWEEPNHRRTFERIGAFSRAVFFDKRGSGLSDPLDRASTLDDRMDDARAVLDAAGVDHVVIGGLSEGGPLAALFAATYPERVDGLVLINSFAGPVPATPQVMLDQFRALQLGRFDEILARWGDVDSPFLEFFAPSVADDPALRQFSARYTTNSMRPAAVRLAVELSFEMNVFPILSAIQVPTLVIHVTEDQVIPFVAGRAMAKAIPGAVFEAFEGTDHAFWLGHLREPILDCVEDFVTGAPRRARAADRALATVLLTDIVDSTATANRLGDEEWRRVLDAHDQLVADALLHHGGRRVKSTGDGVLATFDSPSRGIDCALALRERTASIGLSIRAGLHTGEIELRDDDIGGIAVHLAARVESNARPGDVLVSRTVRDLVVGSHFRFEDRGSYDLKGIEGAWELHAVV